MRKAMVAEDSRTDRKQLVAVCAAAAVAVLLALLGHAYWQLPTLIFAAAAFAGTWLGIASLFSP